MEVIVGREPMADFLAPGFEDFLGDFCETKGFIHCKHEGMMRVCFVDPEWVLFDDGDEGWEVSEETGNQDFPKGQGPQAFNVFTEERYNKIAGKFGVGFDG